MKIKTNIAALLVGLGFLTGCSDAFTLPTPTVGEADNAITLHAGISDGGSGVQTRAGSEDNHNATATGGGHKLFTSSTVAALRIDGDWWKTAEATSGDLISQTTTATMGGKSANDGNGQLHNSLTMSPQRYWDDYGTADPNNTSTTSPGKGREKGLTIYGVAVDGITTAPTVSDWTSLSWTVSQDQSASGVWGTQDLLISNNIKEGKDGTLKFDDLYPTKQSGLSNIMEFTHALSKITVKLIAGDGFPTTGVGATPKRFTTTPDVILTSNQFGKTSEAEWANTQYAVNVMTGVVTTASNTPLAITTTTTKTDDTEFTVVKEALVMPGSAFAEGVQVLSILADGNRYYVSSDKICAAIAAAITAGTHNNSYTAQPGKNYIFKVTLNQTSIDVEATIKDWDEVSAENETPVINIADAYGHEGNGFNRNFDFYRSTAVDGSYLTGITEGNHTVVNYHEATIEPAKSAYYDLTTPMYWPNHSTHYFFRGIWPLVDSQVGESQPVGPTSSQVKANSIEVANVAYKQGYYPSDLMIGIPRKDNGDYDETCMVASHEKTSGANGICATEGKIRMNFQYAMSQVIVKLTTSEGGDKVIFDANTKVEIIGGYTTGEIKLSDESSDFTGKSVTDYEMNREGSSNTLFHDAIIPQSLKNGSGNATLKFRITVKSGDTYDKYETVLGIKDIEVTENGQKSKIDAWSPGKKYTYTLHITKSGIKVEATLKNWIDVDASEDIWF